MNVAMRPEVAGDVDRPVTLYLAQRKAFLGVSKYSPDPEGECDAAEARRRELHMATAPSGDAA